MNNITLNSIEQVLGAREPELSQNLTKLFAKLLERNQDPTFVQNYTGAIKLRFRNEFQTRKGRDPLSFSVFGRACYAAGIVKTFLAVVTSHLYTQSQSQPKERYIGQYNALEALEEFMQTGNLTERRTLLEDMKKNHVVNICLSHLNHPLCIFRQLAINTLRVLASESVLGETSSVTEIADIIAAVCRFTLEGPDFFIEGMRSPNTTWQSQMVMGATDIPAKRAAEHVPRFYAMAQESALWTAHGLLCTTPPPSRKHCLDILKKKPEILDLLFDCAIITRPPWYPETQVDSIACEVIALFFQWPSHIVPGVSTPQDNAFRAQEWKAMTQAVAILTSREDWCEKIIEVWMKIEEEDWREVRGWFDRVEVDYHAFEPPDEDAFGQVFEYRGTSRISMLRLVSTLSHAAESCGVTNAEIESLLRMAYLASRKVKSASELDRSKPEDRYTCVERMEEIFRSPMYTVSLNMTVDAPLQIADESIMGPTALARLLVVLAQRKAFDTIQGLKKAPNGLSSSTCLNHVQQITNPDVIRRFLKIALQRVQASMDKGRERSRENDNNYARVAFTSAAELSAALVAFDNHTQGQYSKEVLGARKELALALGNAAEMAIREKHWQQALYFGSGAVNVAENIPAGEHLDHNITAKNKRRVEQARTAISAK
ncbi:uncharacterized protein F5891DRAFT_1033352 [Suillus fuscotomentosus]|uniref:Uncharacterized protein n=1 Tax=Suillus fuscotomentosus TaxID=1912939 RepID=A0AAD4E605_9AGAM|nr:uncharacterized protein F5891DRAFT_1033352 [Suillus fuscotomentosus]KAG1900306.1 hypothetical protein F5891DRAFT_1033352 [Suillus fuscotomentosus]